MIFNQRRVFLETDTVASSYIMLDKFNFELGRKKAYPFMRQHMFYIIISSVVSCIMVRSSNAEIQAIVV